jgi:hypothetical protein
MALDFPNSPTNGQIYVAGDGSWLWDTTKWKSGNGVGFLAVVGDTPPPNPTPGLLWWNSSPGIGQLYVSYNDGTSQQWVTANNPGAGGQFLPLTGGTVTGSVTIKNNLTVGGGGLGDLYIGTNDYIFFNAGASSAPYMYSSADNSSMYLIMGNSAGSAIVFGSYSGTPGSINVNGVMNVIGSYQVNGRNVTPGQVGVYSNQAGSVPAHGPSGMQGFGYQHTMVNTTRLLVILSGSQVIDGTNATADARLCFGTGTPPVYGAAATGTNICTLQCTTASNIFQIPTTLTAIATGLIIGTTYWFDVYMQLPAGVNGDFFTTNILFLEV